MRRTVFVFLVAVLAALTVLASADLYDGYGPNDHDGEGSDGGWAGRFASGRSRPSEAER